MLTIWQRLGDCDTAKSCACRILVQSNDIRSIIPVLNACQKRAEAYLRTVDCITECRDAREDLLHRLVERRDDVVAALEQQETLRRHDRTVRSEKSYCSATQPCVWDSILPSNFQRSHQEHQTVQWHIKTAKRAGGHATPSVNLEDSRVATSMVAC